MFSLFHFSRVFPYIHPYLFPIETKTAADAAPDFRSESTATCAKPVSATLSAADAAFARAGQVKRLKSLYRRHLLNQRNDVLTYSGALRRTAW